MSPFESNFEGMETHTTRLQDHATYTSPYPTMVINSSHGCLRTCRFQRQRTTTLRVRRTVFGEIFPVVTFVAAVTAVIAAWSVCSAFARCQAQGQRKPSSPTTDGGMTNDHPSEPNGNHGFDGRTVDSHSGNETSLFTYRGRLKYVS